MVGMENVQGTAVVRSAIRLLCLDVPDAGDVGYARLLIDTAICAPTCGGSHWNESSALGFVVGTLVS